MNTRNRQRFIPLLIITTLVVTVSLATVNYAAQPPVNLGSTSSYAVLAGQTITNTGPTTINGDAGGDVGLYPGSAFTGQADVTMSGAVHISDPAAILAKTDLIYAYDDAAGRTPVTRINSELGGATLTPGTYDSADGTFQITGTLTLDAQGDPNGVFVFKTATTLITASYSVVSIINSARYCRIFWQVGTSATLGTYSNFVGHIFALTSITAETGAMVQGQLLARNGSVALDTNTITNGICAVVIPTTSPIVAPTATPTVAPTATPTVAPTATPTVVPTATPTVVPTSTPTVAPTPTTTPTRTPTTTPTTTPTRTPTRTPTTTPTRTSTPAPAPANTYTNTGGQLPETNTHFDLILIGAALTLIGVLGLKYRKRYE